MTAKSMLSAAGVDVAAVEAVLAREQATCDQRKADLKKIRVEQGKDEAAKHAEVALEPNMVAVVAQALDTIPTGLRLELCRVVLHAALTEGGAS